MRLNKMLTLTLSIFLIYQYSLWSDEELNPLMLQPGKSIVIDNFDEDKNNYLFRKKTQFKVQSGLLHVIPPYLDMSGVIPKDDKWATSQFARVTIAKDLPKDFGCELKIKFNQPVNENEVFSVFF